MKSTGALSLFLQSIVSEPYESSSRTSTLSEAEWSLPIPFPEVFQTWDLWYGSLEEEAGGYGGGDP